MAQRIHKRKTLEIKMAYLNRRGARQTHTKALHLSGKNVRFSPSHQKTFPTTEHSLK